MQVLTNQPVLGYFPVTSTHAGILTVAFVAANLAVAQVRASSGKYYGAEPNSVLEYRNRAAGTIQEFGSVGLILLALLEAQGSFGPSGLWWWAALFTTFRIGHAVQLALPRQVPLLLRVIGFYATLALFLFGSLRLLTGHKA